MTLRRRKSRKARAADFLGSYLKFKTAGKAAKGAGKAAKGTGTAAYKVAKRKPRLASLPLIAGAGVAAFFAARALRGGNQQQPAGA